MNQTISVIVPVYNVARYLPECLDSILSQSYTDLEVILIDDGSTDRSAQICDEYAARDNRVRVIHQANGGAGAAKNTGLRSASGTYLSFVDSDDYLDPGAYEYMVAQLREQDAEVIQCCFRYIYTDGVEDIVRLPENKVFPVVDFLRRFTTDWTCGLMTDKLYCRSLFDGIFFEEGNKIDDEYFTYQGIMNASRVLHSPRIIYNYRQRSSGVMLSEESKHRILMDRLDFLPKRRKKVVARFPELRQDFDCHYLNMLVILSKDPAATEEAICRIQSLLREYCREKQRCRVEFTLWRKLLRLRHASPAKLLGEKADTTPEADQDRYFP